MYGSFAVDYAAPAETIFRGDDETKLVDAWAAKQTEEVGGLRKPWVAKF
jgi:hypothetical protein